MRFSALAAKHAPGAQAIATEQEAPKQPVGSGASTPIPAVSMMGDDELYTSPVTIGGQTFLMDFDTGSSDL